MKKMENDLHDVNERWMVDAELAMSTEKEK